MIDIDKLTEAQVRYILNGLIKFRRYGLSDEIQVLIEQPDYPQQTNNEESDND